MFLRRFSNVTPCCCHETMQYIPACLAKRARELQLQFNVRWYLCYVDAILPCSAWPSLCIDIFWAHMADNQRETASLIAENLKLDRHVVHEVVKLLDDDNTVPFIARYRREKTGGLDPTVLRHIQSQNQRQRSANNQQLGTFHVFRNTPVPHPPWTSWNRNQPLGRISCYSRHYSPRNSIS